MVSRMAAALLGSLPLVGAASSIATNRASVGGLGGHAAEQWRCRWGETTTEPAYTCVPGEGIPGSYGSREACVKSCAPQHPPADPLQRWLHDQVIDLPPVSLKKAGVSLALDVRCTELNIGYFQTLVIGQPGPVPYGLDVDLYGLTGVCSGTYSAGIAKIEGTGTVDIRVSPTSALGFRATLSGHPPTAADASCRRTAINVSKLEFGPPGSAISALLNSQQGLLRGVIEGAVPEFVCPLLQDYARGKLTDTLRNFTREIEHLTPAPSAPTPPPPPGTSDLTKSPWIRLVEWAATDLVGEPSPPARPGMNWVTNHLTFNTGGYSLPLNIDVPLQIAVPLDTGVKLSARLDGVQLHGLNTFKDTVLLRSHEDMPTRLSGRGELGEFAAAVYLTLHSVDAAGVKSAGQRFIVAFNASDAQLAYAVDLALNHTEADNFDIWKLIDKDCIVPAISAASIAGLNLNVTFRDFDVRTGSQVGLDSLLVSVARLAWGAYGSTSVGAVDALITKYLPLINFVIAGELLQAKSAITTPCGNGAPDALAVDGSDYQAINSKAGTYLVAVGSVLGLLFTVGGGVLLLRWLRQEDDEKKGAQSLAEVRAAAPELYTGSLFLHVLIPFLLCVCMFSRVVSLSVSIAKIFLTLNVDAAKLADELVIVFSFSELVSDFFSAGAWVVSVLIIAGSSMLPVINIMTMLALWWFPVGSHLRGKILFLTVHSSKLSFIDVMFMSLMTLLFHHDFVLGPSVARMRPQPIFGIFVGISSCCLQKATSSLLLYLHRDHHPAPREAPLLHAQDVDSDDGQTVTTHRGGGKSHVRLAATASTRTIVMAAAAWTVSFATWIVSLFAPLMRFRIGGIVAETQVAATNDKMLRTMTIPSEIYGDTTEHAGISVIIAVYTWLLIAAPLICYLCWFTTWFVPVPMRVHRLCGAAAEHLYSWHGTEVLLLTLFAGWLEMNQIAVFLFKNKVQGIADLVQKYFGTSIMEVKGTWEWGSLCLIVCVVSAALVFNITYNQETFRQQMCNAERKRLAAGKDRSGRALDVHERERRAAAAAAYDSDESMSESERSTVAGRVAAQYFCSIQ
eukprot:TRINITY_DN8498_c0_g2_i1.p1 TRINITY_DN8498_c0_g2~~TRINITY_DN8498_c0_g2_i1.p1  ORF type:complete len:1074 (+),score=292.07 TRINITY_DN8498_c0_g2_i1:166-3387(+)